MIRRTEWIAGACIGVAILSLILPWLLSHRAESRKIHCASRIKEILLGVHNYHSTFRQLPRGASGTSGSSLSQSNQGRLSAFVALLPYTQEQDRWEVISSPYTNPESGKTFPAMGPAPWLSGKTYPPWMDVPGSYQCPADQSINAKVVDRNSSKPLNHLRPVDGNQQGTISYVLCLGDGTDRIGWLPEGEPTEEYMKHQRYSMRGTFQLSFHRRFRDILDGTTSTAFLSETISSPLRSPGQSEIVRRMKGLSKNPSLALKPTTEKTEFWPFGRGARWCFGDPALVAFQTVLPPNSPSATSERGKEDLIASASSRHQGGVHVGMGDGAVIFVADSIDSGDSTSPGIGEPSQGYSKPGKSPFGIWGAMGSIVGKERYEVEQFPIITTLAYPLRPKPGQKLPEGKERMWWDVTKKYRLFADWIEVVDKMSVRLLADDGTIREVPLEQFCDEDIYRAIERQIQKKSDTSR